MVDIAMCQNEVCAKKLECYRYLAVPDPYRQSYAQFDADGCTSYIECRTVSQERRLDAMHEGEEDEEKEVD